jgi:hypothetical protein
VDVLHQEMRGVGRDHDLHRVIGDHHARHAGGEAADLRVVAGSAGSLVGEAGLENRLVFGRQGRQFAAAIRLARIIGGLAGNAGKALRPAADPLALPIGIFLVVECLRARPRRQQRGHQCDCGDQASGMHRSHFLGCRFAIVAGCAIAVWRWHRGRRRQG